MQPHWLKSKWPLLKFSRARYEDRHKIHQRIMQALRQFDDAQWPGLLVVMRDVARSTWRMPETRRTERDTDDSGQS